MLNLIGAFLARGRAVDLVLCQAKGSYLGEVPEGVNLVELRPTGSIRTRWHAARVGIRDLLALLRPVLLARKIAPETARLRALQQYIEDSRPRVIVSALPYANLIAIWAKLKAGYDLPVIVSERIAIATYCAAPSNFRKWRWRYLPALVRRTYPNADKVVAVSNYVAAELTGVVGLPRQIVTTIYNPVVDNSLRERAREALEHPWFNPGGAPVILGVGRLTEQKDFATLIRAFSRVRGDREARLVILGEGSLRADLENLAANLGFGADVDMPGFVANPLKYMARASVLVLSSEYEGLPGVLIQALACGCPVISTNCPGGSAEILADGEYGALVDIGDDDAMARAILAELDTPGSRDQLLRRAESFTVESAVDNYLELIDSLAATAAIRG